jgi:hypothetical protein
MGEEVISSSVVFKEILENLSNCDCGCELIGVCYEGVSDITKFKPDITRKIKFILTMDQLEELYKDLNTLSLHAVVKLQDCIENTIDNYSKDLKDEIIECWAKKLDDYDSVDDLKKLLVNQEIYNISFLTRESVTQVTSITDLVKILNSLDPLFNKLCLNVSFNLTTSFGVSIKKTIQINVDNDDFQEWKNRTNHNVDKPETITAVFR